MDTTAKIENHERETGEKTSFWERHKCLLLKLALISLISGLVYNIGLLYTDCFLGAIYECDEPYMAMNCRYYGDGPLAMLTFYLGHLIQTWFGDEIIFLRLLSRTWILGSIAIPVIYFYHKKRDMIWTLLLANFMLTFYMGNSHLFWGWDAGATLWVSSLFITLISYTDKPTKWKAALAGALCLMMILSRITTAILGVPGVVITLWMMRKSKNLSFYKAFLWSALSFVGAFVVMAYIMKGGIGEYISAWRPENIITGHKVSDYYHFWIRTENMLHIEKAFFPYNMKIVILALIIIAYRKVFGLKGLLVMTFILWMLCNDDAYAYYEGNMDLFFIPFVLIGAIVAKRWLNKGFRPQDKEKLSLILLFALVPAVGSDNPLKHIMFYYTLPVLMLMVYRWRNGFLLLLMILFMVPAMAAHGVSTITNLSKCYPASEYLPHHKYVYQYNEKFSDNIDKLKPYIDSLKRENKKYVFMDAIRYFSAYLYSDDKPYRFQQFHFYTLEVAEEFLYDSLSKGYVVIACRASQPFPNGGLQKYARSIGATVTDNGYGWDYYELPDNVKLQK